MVSIKSDQDIIWMASDYIYNFDGKVSFQRTIIFHTPRFQQSIHPLKSIQGPF
ncbi:hypothetical protein [Candidatus Odyssella thessalonicensis]|uniref:hypothetical protein n=1 Tax=Candidatus Odyssella thessalonicensis TaxID=84647 RepID=UPI000225AC95|nr:hypothetical protein [Candidatus Odyssella thessalonicensis]